MKLHLVRLASAVAAAVLLLVQPGVAQAATITIADPAGDARVIKGRPTATQKAAADLVAVSYWRASGRVYVRWQVRDLKPGARLTDFAWQSGRFYLSNSPGSTTTHLFKGSVVRCKATAKRNNTANTLTVSLKKSCFPKGKTFTSPFALAESQNKAGTKIAADDTAAGPAFVPNP